MQHKLQKMDIESLHRKSTTSWLTCQNVVQIVIGRIVHQLYNKLIE